MAYWVNVLHEYGITHFEVLNELRELSRQRFQERLDKWEGERSGTAYWKYVCGESEVVSASKPEE